MSAALTIIFDIVLIVVVVIIAAKFIWPVLIHEIADTAKIHKMQKQIVGVNTFDNAAHAKEERDRAILANAKWKHAFNTTLFIGVICLLAIFLGWLITLSTGINVSRAIHGIVFLVSYISLLSAVKYIGRWYGKYLLAWMFSGHDALIFLFFLIEALFLFMLWVLAYGMLIAYGLSAFTLFIDRYFINQVILSTDEYGFDDSSVNEEAHRFEEEGQGKEDAFKADAGDFVHHWTEKGEQAAKAGFAEYEKAKKRSDESRSADRAEKIWYCPSCGNKNTGKFCSQCGTPKPERDAES